MINRDAYTTSLWQDHAFPIDEQKTANHHQIYDVIIIGGGITGISTAFLLQDEGQQCLVLEAKNIGFGTTGGTTAHLNTLLDTPYYTIEKNFGTEEAREVCKSAAEAIELIRHNVDRLGIDCGFEYTDGYLFAQSKEQEEELEMIYKSAAAAGVEVEFSKSIPVPIPFSRAIRAGRQAKFNPINYVQGLAKAFKELGGIILQENRVIRVENEASYVQVETNAGTFRSRSVVYATHIPPGINLLHLRCVPYRSYAMAIVLDDDQYPDGLSYDLYDPYRYYRTQEVDGQKYLIAGGEDHETGHMENNSQCFLRLENYLKQHFKIREIKYRWSSQYYEPADGLPYIGNLPGQADNVYVCTGYGGNGMTYSSVAALLLTRTILKRDAKYLHLYDPNRIKPIAGFTSFITHNADVVKQFIDKMINKEHLNQLTDIAPGEAKVVEYEGQKIAIYKNEQGELKAVNPVCAHMKCDVKWNEAERSWDCPCHGARYDVNGNVLNTPADKGLEHLEL
jgi:glycine/D-amino acid oxidase-like deaminating enzyme/nitrite reductase/ring-hydroxylating ferredoxin subunit